MLRSAVLLVSLLVALPASAERSKEAEEAAAEAAEVFEAYCSQTALEDTTVAAGAVAEVSAIWQRVSAALDSSRKVYLLYWRGALAQCLDQEARALEDLKGFVGATEGSTLWSSLITDARRRIRRLEVRAAGGPQNPGLAAGVIGAVLAGGSGATAGLAGWQWSVALDRANTLTSEVHESNEANEFFIQGQLASQFTPGLAIGAGVLGAGALVAFISSAATKAKWSASAPAVQPVFAAVPTPDGFVLVAGGRW